MAATAKLKPFTSLETAGPQDWRRIMAEEQAMPYGRRTASLLVMLLREQQGDPDYEREINIVHDAAIKAGVKLCGPWAWRNRPDFTCFQAGNEMAAIARGVKIELGEHADTQARPEIGPFAASRAPTR